MSFLFFLWILFNVLIGYNLVLPFIEYLLFKIIGDKKVSAVSSEPEPDYGIIVTAYEHLGAVNAAVNSLLRMNYSNYLIYIVADKCDVSTLRFEDERVIILRPEETLASNTRSHFYAINRFRRAHKYMTIIDSDNLAEAEYLNEINKYFRQGFEAIQGVRKAKNLDTVYARLDAVQDLYYNLYDRKIVFRLGSSATLAGSGMAFTTELYKSVLGHLDIVGAGFDKVLQAEIVKSGRQIAFSEHAIVYDEKTSKSDQLVKQRARWFNTWFKYAALGVQIFGRGVTKFDRNQFLFGLFLLRPPLFLIVISSFVLMLVNIFISVPVFLAWVSAFFLFFVALLLSLNYFKAEKKIYQSLFGIPVFIFFQILSLLKVRKANKHSVATPHYHTSTIEDLKAQPK